MLAFLLPTELSLSIKLIILISLIAGNLLFYLCTIITEFNQLDNNYKKLRSEYNTLVESKNDLKKKHGALAKQFINKNHDIDNLEHQLSSYNLLFNNITLILHYFLAQPSNQEVSCIEKVIKYINDNHIKE
ncbi:UNVERIFIED_ORG: hypothetical protein B2H98_05435 [Clostridium botulinum]